MQRSCYLNVRMSKEELASLKRQAKKAGLNVSDVVRIWIRQEHPVTISKEKARG
jgi:predicted DNA binding CopG/RHH family protein